MALLDGVDLSDPCAVWPVLQRAYLSLLAGEGVQTARFGTDEVTFSRTNLGELRGEIDRLRAECERGTGARPRRRAIRVGNSRW